MRCSSSRGRAAGNRPVGNNNLVDGGTGSGAGRQHDSAQGLAARDAVHVRQESDARVAQDNRYYLKRNKIADFILHGWLILPLVPDSVSAYPHADELLVKNDPRQEVHAGNVRREQGHDLRREKYSEWMDIHVVRGDPQQAEQAAPRQESGCELQSKSATFI